MIQLDMKKYYIEINSYFLPRAQGSTLLAMTKLLSYYVNIVIMTTVPEIINTISHNIQHAFEELTKLLLRKTIKPVLNPYGLNTKLIYNPKTMKYERGYYGWNPADNVNKYTYILTHDCLGWVADSVTTFKSLAKFMKNNYPPRHPQGAANTRDAKLQKNVVAYSARQRQYAIAIGKIPPMTQYKNFTEIVTARTMQNTIYNRKGAYAYTCDVPYTDCFKQLENIGRDIINQTDPSIPPADSAIMSTAWLRIKLFNLEESLTSLSVSYPDIYSSYLCMVKLINSVQRDLMFWVINLIATLSYQNWDDLTEEQQHTYIHVLGECFIDSFNCNELITILLQGNASELILTASYLYSLLKMLFIVFGYSELTPTITTTCGGGCETPSTVPASHIAKYRGAGIRRGDSLDSSACCKSCAGPCGGSCSGKSSCKTGCPTECPTPCINPCEPTCVPVDQCLLAFIASFGDLYPTIVSIIGGTECFPPECSKLNCNKIPANYNCLECIPEFLWRFNNFAYCQYLDFLATKQITNIRAAQINAKTHFLQTL